jgi:hypothetical protein
MKFLKNGLRIWITAASLAGFLGGWGLLAHAGKPVPFVSQAPVSTVAPLPTLEPLAPLNSISPNQLQPLPSMPSTRTIFPRMRTRGS